MRILLFCPLGFLRISHRGLSTSSRLHFSVNITFVSTVFWDYLFLWIPLSFYYHFCECCFSRLPFSFYCFSRLPFSVNTTSVNTAFWAYLSPCEYHFFVNTTFVVCKFFWPFTYLKSWIFTWKIYFLTLKADQDPDPDPDSHLHWHKKLGLDPNSHWN